MIRYSLILFVFVLLILYVLHLGRRGQISGRFKAVSLVLLGILIILVSTGLYYNTKYYSVQTVQEDFSQNRKDILKRIRDLQAEGQYAQARKLVEEYQDVQDPALDKLYRESREAELLKKAESLEGSSPQQQLPVWKELVELTGKATYRDKLRQQQDTLARQAEKAILDRIQELPPWSLSAKALGYRLLQRIDPRNITYQQRYDSLKQAANERIQDSPWNDICSASSIPACAHFGYIVRLDNGQESATGNRTGEILGVSRRSKGTLIDRQGTTAPEDGDYYILLDSDRLSLRNVQFVEATNPFGSITIPNQGDSYDQR